ncbi:uncharacterized protein (DUF427 family) [Marmoricola sp. URHA0025 HA25]
MATQMRKALAGLHEELRYEPVTQRIRISLGDVVVAETTGAVLVWEPRRVVPSYAVPRADLRAELVELDVPADDPAAAPPVLAPGQFGPHLAPGTVVTLRIGDTLVEQAGFVLADPDLADHVLLDWDAFEWVEEATVMTGHAQDPFKRIKTLASARRVQVSFGDQVLADSSRGVLLLETSLPPRWYLPSADVRTDLLEPSKAHSVCAYKGRASYWSLVDAAGGPDDGRDIAWSYPDPLHDALPVKDLLCFWVERTDLTIDGAAVPRPFSPFAGRP